MVPARCYAPRYDRTSVSTAPVVIVSIEVSWVDLDPAASELRSLSTLLTDDERARVAARATPTLRRRATVSLARRRLLAAEVLGVTPRAVQLVVSPDGRRLASALGSEPLGISVSTSGDHGLVAVASAGSVGVDVEDFGGGPSTPAFVARVASPSERTSLEARLPADRERALLRLWTRKEAYLKATGEGIGTDLQRIEAPLEGGIWAARWQPLNGAAWHLYDLDCPRPELAAALVAGPASPAGGSVPTLRVRLG